MSPSPLDMGLTQRYPWPRSHLWFQLRSDIFRLCNFGQGPLSQLVKRMGYDGSWADYPGAFLD